VRREEKREHEEQGSDNKFICGGLQHWGMRVSGGSFKAREVRG
jgi:hypothetical protein